MKDKVVICINTPKNRYSTKNACDHSGAIDQQDYLLIKNQMLNLFDDENIFRKFVGKFLTQPKHELDLISENDEFSHQEISNLLLEHSLMRIGGLRAFYFTETIDSGICYINGEEITFPAQISSAIKLLCDNVCLDHDAIPLWQDNELFVEFIKQQIELGYWFFAE